MASKSKKSASLLSRQLKAARKDAGYGGSLRKAEEAMREAEGAGYGEAVSFDTIRLHEDGQKVPAEVLLCYGATYKKNPIWLVSRLGPPDWDPEQYSRDAQKAFLAQLRSVASWMVRAAKAGSPVLDLVEGVPQAGIEGEDLGPDTQDPGLGKDKTGN